MSTPSENTNMKKVQIEICVVPWYSASQFRKVYENLYSPKVEKKRWALDQISVWETRCHPSLPAAIEATYGLTSAVVQDILWMNGASVSTQIDIQHLYSAAITRFVNVTVEIHNRAGKTMATTANGLGIPSFIIDLRNEATHSVRPSLSCLRIAAEIALKYLKESYWDIEVGRIFDYVKQPVDESKIMKVIQRYLAMQLEELYKQARSRKQYVSYSSGTKRVLIQMEKLIKQDKRLFVNILSSVDGLFIPNEDDMKDVISEEELMMLQEGYEEDSSHFDSILIPTVPLYYETIWCNALGLLNAYDAIPLLLESLLRTQGDRTVYGQKLVISWVTRILKIHTIGGRLESGFLTCLFKEKAIVVNWYSMFYAAIANPCKYTPFVLPLIFCNLDLKKHVTQRVLNLLAIYLGQAKDATYHLPKNPTVFTVEQLKQIKHLQKVEREKMKGGSEKSIWVPVVDDSYKRWPVGCIINPQSTEEKEQPEEDDFDEFVVNDEFTEKFIINNENDSEEEHYVMDIERPDTFESDVIQELKKRKSFLYTK